MKHRVFFSLALLIGSLLFIQSSCNEEDDPPKIPSGDKSWNKIDLNVSTAGLNDIVFKNKLEGWAIGDSGTLISTADSGNTWEKKIISPNNLKKIFYLNDSNAWIIGENKTILFSNNKWESHVNQSAPLNADFNDIHFISKTKGWIVGSNASNQGFVLATTTGGSGTGWTQQITPSGVPGLNDVHFVNALEGYAFGNNGAYIKTMDGGFTWTAGNYITNYNIECVTYVNFETAFGVGERGLYIFSFEGLDNWQSGNQIALSVLKDIVFVNNDLGWISGVGGILFRSTNGGFSWTNIPLGNSADANALFFHNMFEGWLAGKTKTNEGIIFKYEDEIE